MQMVLHENMPEGYWKENLYCVKFMTFGLVMTFLWWLSELETEDCTHQKCAATPCVFLLSR